MGNKESLSGKIILPKSIVERIRCVGLAAQITNIFVTLVVQALHFKYSTISKSKAIRLSF